MDETHALTLEGSALLDMIDCFLSWLGWMREGKRREEQASELTLATDGTDNGTKVEEDVIVTQYYGVVATIRQCLGKTEVDRELRSSISVTLSDSRPKGRVVNRIGLHFPC